MNKPLLLSTMKLKNDSLKDLALYLDISTQAVSLKINEKSQFKQNEIKGIKEKYNLTPYQVDNIFF